MQAGALRHAAARLCSYKAAAVQRKRLHPCPAAKDFVQTHKRSVPDGMQGRADELLPLLFPHLADLSRTGGIANADAHVPLLQHRTQNSLF